ncbi:RiPP maturation radical SAM C-methyltransferase [Rhizobium leguminosarum]|uniref:RiPP maturation radical SAM C-methyltransferase n=1 Tax=Rhizobium leguminosarum TaxID=384 RepID=UPI003F974501
MAVSTKRIEFVSMPFGPLMTPSLALGLLKSRLTQAGINSSVNYLNVAYAKVIEPARYHLIACGLPRAHDLLGEFIFASALFGNRDSENYKSYLKSIYTSDRLRYATEDVAIFLSNILLDLEGLCEASSLFVKDEARRIAERRPGIVAFTSVFQQHVASLALAKEISALDPSILLMIGGANCEGKMGEATFQEFPFLDVLVSGEADEVIVPLVRAALEGKLSQFQTPGVLIRAHEHAPKNQLVGSVPSLAHLNNNPTPDFDDYFTAIRGEELPERPRLLYETSRGCWWGAKHHCTFCGLNGSTMQFRSKDPALALNQLAHLVERYPGLEVGMADNIMDHRYFDTFLPAMVKSNINVDLFYEMKANIKQSQVALLKSAGIKRIQPGIESLSSNVLRLMDKGITALQNVQLLKWCKQYGISAEWNLLWGFPGESSEDYHAMRIWIECIPHLQPPNGVGRLRIDRFSPNYEKHRDRFRNIRPFQAYEMIYQSISHAVPSLAYYFDFDSDDSIELTTAKEQIANLVHDWRRYNASHSLSMKKHPLGMLVRDSRVLSGMSTTTIHICHDVAAAILAAGDSIVNEHDTCERLSSQYGAAKVSDGFYFLDERGLILRENGNYLALPIWEDGHSKEMSVAYE